MPFNQDKTNYHNEKYTLIWDDPHPDCRHVFVKEIVNGVIYFYDGDEWMPGLDTPSTRVVLDAPLKNSLLHKAMVDTFTVIVPGWHDEPVVAYWDLSRKSQVYMDMKKERENQERQPDSANAEVGA